MKRLLLLGILAAMSACGTDRNAELPVLDMEAAMSGGLQAPDTFTLNDILEVTDIIPIETRPDALIGTTRMIKIGKDHCYVSHDNKISRIDHEGKIITTIARQGRGPGEYLQPTVVDVNENNSTIRVFDRQGDKYVTYNMEGSTISEGSLSEKGVELPRFLGDDWMVVRGTAEGAFRHYITDREMNILQGLFPMDTTLNRLERFSLTQQVNVASGGDGALVNLSAQDTLYRVTGRGMTPEAILKKGRYRSPEELMVINPANANPLNPTIISSNVGALGGDYYLVNYILDTGLAMQIWHKDGSLVAHTDNLDGFDKYGFRFAFPSGAEMRISTFHLDGDTIAFVVNALHAAGSVAGVKEDDNPVIIIAKLKE